MRETDNFRNIEQGSFLPHNGYGSHILCKTLRLIEDYNTIAVELNRHTSHVTRYLCFSVILWYKSYFQDEPNKPPRQNALTNAFDVAQCLSNAFYTAHGDGNIWSGFHRKCIWGVELQKMSFVPLDMVFNRITNSLSTLITFAKCRKNFAKRYGMFLQDSVVKTCHVFVDISSDAQCFSCSTKEGEKSQWHTGKETLKCRKPKLSLAC